MVIQEEKEGVGAQTIVNVAQGSTNEQQNRVRQLDFVKEWLPQLIALMQNFNIRKDHFEGKVIGNQIGNIRVVRAFDFQEI